MKFTEKEIQNLNNTLKDKTPLEITQWAVLNAKTPVVTTNFSDVSGSTPNTTDHLLRKVLVTAVQDRGGTTADEDAQRLTIAPEGTVFVTLAVSPRDANKVVFGAEFGQLWLAIERETVPEADEPAQTRGNVLLDSGDAS